MFSNPTIRHTSRVVCGFLRLLSASCFLHLLQPVVFVFFYLLQPVAYPLSPGHAWLCRVLLDALYLWEPALVLKRLWVCRFREWLAKPLQKPTNKIIRQFLALTRIWADTSQVQIAWQLSRTNVNCPAFFMSIIDGGRIITRYQWFEVAFVRFFYLF